MPKKPLNNNAAGRAAVLSFLFNGLGQIYNGQIKKGLTLMSLSGIAMLIVLIGAIIVGFCLLNTPLSITGLIIGVVLLCLGIVSIAVIGVHNIYDAYNNAK